MLAFFVFSAVICGFSQAHVTDTQVHWLIDNAKQREELVVTPLPDVDNEDFQFKPFRALLKEFVFKGHFKLDDFWVRGLNSMEVLRVERPEPENRERLNAVLIFPNLKINATYDIKSKDGSIESQGVINGNITGVTVNAPVSTDNDIITLVGPVRFDLKTQHLKFTKGENKAKQALLNMFQCLMHDAVRALLRDEVIPYCEDIVLMIVNDLMPQLRADQIA